jgi:hypothetical protein
MFLIPLGISIYLLRKWYIIKSTAQTMIKDLKPGLVEIKGNAIPWGHELIAPFTRMPCTRYMSRIYRYIEREVNDHEYYEQKNVWQEIRGNKFILTDGTGSVRVDPKDHVIDMKKVLYEEVNGVSYPWPIERFFMSKPKRFRSKVMFKGGPFYFEETVLPIGQEVYVLGTAEKIPPGGIRLKGEKAGDMQIVNRDEFFLSFGGEKEAAFKYKWGGILLLIFALSILLFYSLIIVVSFVY